jgi:protein-tyrosine-phosphatase
MAAALLWHMSGGRIRVESCGIRIGHINAFAIAIMDEIRIDLTDHQSKQFDDLADAQFDLVVSLTPEAHHHAVELTGGVALEIVYWPTMDPAIVTGSRDQILHAFRQLRGRPATRV